MKKTKLLVALIAVLVVALSAGVVLSACDTACKDGHTWDNGKCTVCGTECDHPRYGADGKCTTCGLARPDPCKDGHTWDAQTGVCSVCKTACTHAWSDAYLCTICGLQSTACDVNGHTWDAETGKCSVCETACAHKWNPEDGSCTVCAAECPHAVGFENGVCKNCGLAVDGVCAQLGHDWDDEEGVCAVCGLKCPHPYGFDGDRYCYICSWQRPWDCEIDGHVWDPETGICDECEEVCPHDKYNGITCVVCKHQIAPHDCKTDGHVYSFGTCTYCENVCKHTGGYDADNLCKDCGASKNAYWVNDTKTYTYRMGPNDIPSAWNYHTYESNAATYILDWTTSSLYSFDYNETGDAFKIVPAMASDYAIDVSHEYVGKYGIEKGDYGRVYQIPLKTYLKFDNGDPITADTFVESMKLLLDPVAANFRADNVYQSGNLKIYGAEAYAKQGKKTLEDTTDGTGIGVGEFTGWDNMTDDLAAKLFFSAGKSYVAQYFVERGFVSQAQADNGLCFAHYFLNDQTKKDAIAALEGKTLAEIRADAEARALLDACIAGWCTDPDEEFGFFRYEYTWPDYEFTTDTVGFFAKDAYTLVVVLRDAMEDNFYLRRELCTDFFLVHPEKYKECISMEGGVYTNSYATSLDKYIGCGPYKLVTYVKDSEIALARNPYWYGYFEAERAGQYQTTNVSYKVVANDAARKEAFLKGELESFGLSGDDVAEFISSKNIYYDDSESTWFLVMNPQLENLEKVQAEAKPETAGNKVIKTVLTIDEFRKALSYSLDREAFNLRLSPTSGVAKCLLSPMIIADPDLGISYRSLDEAKDAILSFWGLADEWGPGKTYPTRDAAIASITGYDPEGAKVLFRQAYDIAIELELFENAGIDPETDKWEVQIVIGMPSKSAKFYTGGAEVLATTWTDAVKDTPFEGHMAFVQSHELGSSDFGSFLRNGEVDLLFGVGYGGDMFNPYSMMDCFTGSLQYDAFTDMKTKFLDIDINGKTLRASLYAWVSECLQGTPINASVVDKDGNATDEKVEVDGGVNCPFATRVHILAKCEEAIMNISNVFPLMTDASAHLRGERLTYKTEEYILGLGRGGVRYYTYKYDDAEWAAWVANWCKEHNTDNLADFYK